MKANDILTLKENVLVSYDHGSDKGNHIRLNIGDKLRVVSINVNNPDFVRVTREVYNDNITLRKSNFK